MSTKSTPRRKVRRNINLLIANEFFAELRFYMPVAVLAFESITGSYTTAMSVIALSFLAQALFEVPTGVLSDKWGRRGTLLIGTFGELLSVLCYALAFSSPHPFWLLYLGSVLYGFSNALFSGNNHAMIYETLASFRRTKETAKILGRVSSLGQIALGISGVLAGLLLWLGMSFESLVYLSLASLSINLLVAFWTIEPPCRCIEDGHAWAHMKKALKLIVKNKKLRLYTIASIVQGGGGFANYYFTPSFVDSVWPTWLTPFYRTGQHIIGALSFWFAGAVIKRFTAIKVLLVGTFSSYIVATSALVLSNIASPILLMLTQIVYGTSTTADRVVQQENFSDAQRSTMGSLISVGIAVMTAISSVLLGWISDLSTPAFAMGFMMLSRAVFVQSIYFRIYKKHS